MGQRELARLIGVSAAYLNDLEHSKRQAPSNKVLILLKEKLDQLDIKYRELKYSNSIESMVWQKLGGRTKKEEKII